MVKFLLNKKVNYQACEKAPGREEIDSTYYAALYKYKKIIKML